MNNNLYIIVPCYNNEKTIENFNDKLIKKLDNLILNEKVSSTSKILYVNNGSEDNTLSIIKDITNKTDKVLFLSLTKKFDNNNAIYAALNVIFNKADLFLTIDTNCNDKLIDKMINAYYEDNHIIYAINNNIKVSRNKLIFRLIKPFINDSIYLNTDYYLFDKKVLNNILKYPNFNEMIPKLGYKSSIIFYDSKIPKNNIIKLNNEVIFNSLIKVSSILVLINVTLLIIAFISKLISNYGFNFILISLILFVTSIILLLISFVAKCLDNKVNNDINYVIEENIVNKDDYTSFL